MRKYIYLVNPTCWVPVQDNNKITTKKHNLYKKYYYKKIYTQNIITTKFKYVKYVHTDTLLTKQKYPDH